MHAFAKGQYVTYTTGTSTVVAQVTTCHRDGSYTVTAQFHLLPSGRPARGYLGFKYRMSGDDLKPRTAA